jgi:alpha-mannosidase
LNYKLIALPTATHEGKLPAEHSFVQTKSENVIVTAVKKAEDDNALIVRFFEWAGKQGDVSIELPTGAASASETDLMEKPLGNLSVSNAVLNVPTKPFEIKTVKVQFSGVPADAGDTRP